MSNEKILIVEDDGIVALDIQSRLVAFGYSACGTANNGENAIKKAEELKPDLVLMDIVLKGDMDGIEAAEIIQSRFQIPVVFVTAHADTKRFERAKQIGPFGYVLKPFRDREFKITIEMALYKAHVDEKRWQSEEALKDSREKYHVLFKSASDAVFVIDVETLCILEGNEAAEKIYGYSHDEFLKMKVTDLSDEVEKTKTMVRKNFATTIPLRYHKKKDGTIFPVEIKTNSLKLKGRKINIGNIRDISERIEAEKEKRQFEAQLVLSQKMESVGILAAGIAHEINNPVGFVSSNLDTLSNYMKDVDQLLKYYQQLSDTLKGHKQEHFSDTIKKQIKAITKYEEDIDIDYLKGDIPELLKDCRDGTKRVGRIVKDLKTFAHPGNDEPVTFDINEGLESTLNIVNNELKYKATVIKNFEEVPLVKGYPQKLNQVFMNILVNAAQAILKKGEIKIQTKQNKGNVIVSISDTGAGIEEENLLKLFDPFFTTKDVGKGTGLGMNISYNIIKEHDGTIDVKSTVGKGTTFTITLPGQE